MSAETMRRRVEAESHHVENKQKAQENMSDPRVKLLYLCLHKQSDDLVFDAVLTFFKRVYVPIQQFKDALERFAVHMTQVSGVTDKRMETK